MSCAPFFRTARRAEGSAGGAFLAVAFALFIVAADVPAPEAPGNGPTSGEQEALEAALKTEKSWIEHTAALSWGEVPPGTQDAQMRARLAAQAALDALSARYPGSEGTYRVDLTERSVSTPDAPSRLLAPEHALRIAGVLRASAPPHGERSEAVEVVSRDPLMPRGFQYLDRRLAEQAADPRSASAAAVRLAVLSASVLGVELQDGALDPALDAALAVAARSLEGELDMPGPAASALPLMDEDRASLPEDGWAGAAANLSSLPPNIFAAFLKAFLKGFPGNGAAGALLSMLPWLNATLLTTALALMMGDEGPLKAAVRALPFGLGAPISEVSGLLRAALTAMLTELQSATARASEALRRFAPTARARWPGGDDVRVELHAHGARLTKAMASPAASLPDGTIVPSVSIATVECTLESSVRVREAGQWVEASRKDPFRLTVSFLPQGAAGWQGVGPIEARPPDSLRAVELAGPLSSAVGLLETLRGGIDQRLLNFRDAVSRRIAESSAGGFARLAFRILDGLESNDSNQSARALFELMERYFADDLRDALTVNLSIYGVNFTLIPDPVRQQVTLEHTEGPHTFGVRVRRIFALENPLIPKFPDHLSLALELFWRYQASPVVALLTLDPFLRTDEGLLRFTLRVEEGDGLQITVVAPRIGRRAGTWELALSDFVPGGIPIGVTPSGGALTLDAGARIEFAGATPVTVVRFVLRAVEGALFDVLENQTVRDIRDQLSVGPLARRFLERFVERLADTFAEAASRFVLRAELFVRLRWLEAAGAVSGTLEVGLAVDEPLIVFRQAGASAAALAGAGLDSVLLDGPAAFRPLDFVPTAIHERVGPAIKISVRGGLDGIPLLGRALAFMPHAEVEQTLFLSLGALAAEAGRAAIHWVSDYALGFEGLSSRPRALLPYRLAAGDTFEAVHLRVESLAGPRIMISEVLPAPAGNDSDLEFVELYNPAPAQEDLTGWSLTDATGHSFRFPDGTRIGPGATLVLSRSGLPFFRRFGVAAQVPTLTLTLNDEGDRLRLANPRGWTSDEVAWGALGPLAPAPLTDQSLARAKARGPQAEVPWSALQFSGSLSDFVLSDPTPGRLD